MPLLPFPGNDKSNKTSHNGAESGKAEESKKKPSTHNVASKVSQEAVSRSGTAAAKEGSTKKPNSQYEDAFRENKDVASVEAAKSVTSLRVKYLQNLLSQEDIHKIATTETRDAVWKILLSFDDWKQWQFEISRTLVVEAYPDIAVGLLTPCLQHLSTAKHAHDEGTYKLARNLLASLINFNEANAAFKRAVYSSSIMSELLKFLSAASNNQLVNQNGKQLLIKNCLLLPLGLFGTGGIPSVDKDVAETNIKMFGSYVLSMQDEECRCQAALCILAIGEGNDTLEEFIDSRDLATLFFSYLPTVLGKQDFMFARWIVHGLSCLNKNSENHKYLKQLATDVNKKQLQRVLENCCFFRTSELKEARDLLISVFGDDTFVDSVQLKSTDDMMDMDTARKENELCVDFLFKLNDISPNSLVCLDAAIAVCHLKKFKNYICNVKSDEKQKAAFTEAMTQKDLAEIAFRYVKCLLNRDITKEDLSNEMLSGFMSLLWDLSDQSEQIRIKITKAGFVDYFLSLFKEVGEVDKRILYSERWVFALLNAVAAILYNTSRTSQVKYKYLQHDASNILVPYLDEKYKRAITVSLCIAYVVSDTPEAAKLADERGILVRLTKLAVDAMQYANRLSQAGGEKFWLAELLDGLCLLATNDANKQKLMDNGVVELLNKLLLKGEPSEQVRGLDLLWTLCFDQTVRQKITTDHKKDIMEPVQALLQSGDVKEEVKKAAEKTMNFIQKWSEMEAAKAANIEVTASSENKALKGGHIFISYSWKQQETALQIRRTLLDRNHMVWMDVDKMHGGLLDAMAKAVEEAAIMLLCFSQSYKESNPCRAEAQYAYSLGKPIIPINMEYHYKPDGWLGIIVLPLLYVDMSLKKSTFEQAAEKLLSVLANSLGASGQKAIGPPNDDNSGRTHGSIITTQSKSIDDVMQPLRNRAPSEVPRFSKWTIAEVQSWVKKEKLPKQLEAKFERLDGEKLWTLLSIKQESPDFFYHEVKSHFGANMPDLMQVIAAFNRLIIQTD